jgi:hypothetical protein
MNTIRFPFGDQLPGALSPPGFDVMWVRPPPSEVRIVWIPFWLPSSLNVSQRSSVPSGDALPHGLKRPGVLSVDVAERSVVGIDDPRAAARQRRRSAGRDAGAVREPLRALGRIRWSLNESLTGAVRVNDVDLRVAERGIEPRERDLAVHPWWSRPGWKRRRCRDHEGEQRNETDSSVKQRSHMCLPLPGLLAEEGGPPQSAACIARPDARRDDEIHSAKAMRRLVHIEDADNQGGEQGRASSSLRAMTRIITAPFRMVGQLFLWVGRVLTGRTRR